MIWLIVQFSGYCQIDVEKYDLKNGLESRRKLLSVKNVREGMKREIATRDIIWGYSKRVKAVWSDPHSSKGSTTKL